MKLHPGDLVKCGITPFASLWVSLLTDTRVKNKTTYAINKNEIAIVISSIKTSGFNFIYVLCSNNRCGWVMSDRFYKA